MLFSSYLAWSLLLPTEILANPVASIINITDISSPVDSDIDPIACLSQDSEYAPIYNPDCFVLMNDILLSLYTRVNRVWALIRLNYPRNYRACSISFFRGDPRGDPLERFPEYQMAISAAVVVKRCNTARKGGSKYITQSHQFAAKVENPNSPVTGTSDLLLLPSTNGTEGFLESNSSEVSTANDTSVVLPPISNLNATISCYPPPEEPQPITKGDCYELFYNMLIRPDILTSYSWVGRNPGRAGGPWNWDTCGVSVLGRSSLSTGYFKLIDPVVAAAHIARTCFVDRGLAYGGQMSVPDQSRFYVDVSYKATRLADNTISVENA